MCGDRSSVQLKYKDKRRQNNTESKRRSRSQPEFKEYERQYNRAIKRMAREEPGFRGVERECNKKSKQIARKDQAYRDNERECSRKSKQIARKDQAYRDSERECSKKGKQIARKDQAYRDNERESIRKCKQIAREDQAYRDSERECSRKSKQMAREDQEYRDSERECSRKSKQIAREDPANRIREQMHDAERKRTSRNKQQSLDDLIKVFHKEVAKGPVHKCCVCDQLWYRHSVVLIQRNNLSDCNAVDLCVPDIRQSKGNELICNTCLSHLKKKKIPPSSSANGMGFPVIPQHLKVLHQVEWRLVSPRIPFMKVFAAPRGGQKKIRGNVVNVPCDTVNTFQVLPHSGSEHQTIQVKIKRDLRYANHVMSQNVRPYKVREAAEYLVTHGKLFKEQGISFDKTWAENDELSNNDDINEGSMLQIDTNVGEPHING